MKKLFLLLTFLISSFNSFAVSDEKIIDSLTYSDSLEEFWYGDDGESCGKPEISIIEHQEVDRTLVVVINKTGYEIGCYETRHTCTVKYILEDEEVMPLPVETYRDCD